MDTVEHIKKARERLEKRYFLRQAAHRELHGEALKDFKAILAMIIERFQPRRLYQWGSLLEPVKFREYSDIDLAVEGISSPQAYFDMVDAAQSLTRFPVDIVQMEKIEPEFADDIRQHGRLVYEREG